LQINIRLLNYPLKFAIFVIPLKIAPRSLAKYGSRAVLKSAKMLLKFVAAANLLIIAHLQNLVQAYFISKQQIGLNPRASEIYK